MKISNAIRISSFILGSSALLIGCKEMYNLPEDRDFISENITYNNKVIEPILGRHNMHEGLSLDNTTLPLSFEIVNPRYGDGRPYTDIFQKAQVYEWLSEYDGKEKSLEEIEAKRHMVEKPLFEVDQHGRFILYGASDNELIEPRPVDTVLKTQDIRFFDLKVKNSGGERIIKDFQFIPWRQRDYSPSTDINPYTGGVAPDPRNPKDPSKRDYIKPAWFTNIVGENTNVNLKNDERQTDIVVYIRRFEGGNGKSLRFKFLGADGNFINPVKFNETKWDMLVHGFNKTMTPEYVQYDVAYPIPLTGINTDYNSGSNARVVFKYTRTGFGGTLTSAEMGFDFRIFKAGDWEIVFHFTRENPKFEDE